MLYTTDSVMPANLETFRIGFRGLFLLKEVGAGSSVHVSSRIPLKSDSQEELPYQPLTSLLYSSLFGEYQKSSRNTKWHFALLPQPWYPQAWSVRFDDVDLSLPWWDLALTRSRDFVVFVQVTREFCPHTKVTGLSIGLWLVVLQKRSALLLTI